MISKISKQATKLKTSVVNKVRGVDLESEALETDYSLEFIKTYLQSPDLERKQQYKRAELNFEVDSLNGFYGDDAMINAHGKSLLLSEKPSQQEHQSPQSLHRA